MVGWPAIVFASVGTDGWTRNNTALSRNALVRSFIGCATDGLSGTATIRAPVVRLRLNVTRQPD
jgi:hypothetical protein